MLTLESKKLLKFESNDCAIINLFKPKSVLEVKVKTVHITKDKIAIFLEYPDDFVGAGTYSFAIYIDREAMCYITREILEGATYIKYTRAGYLYDFKIIEDTDSPLVMTYVKDPE